MGMSLGEEMGAWERGRKGEIHSSWWYRGLNLPFFQRLIIHARTINMQIYRFNFMGFVLFFLFVDVIDGRGLQIFLLHEDVSLQYYIPAVAR